MPTPEIDVPSPPLPSEEKVSSPSFWEKLMKDDISQPIMTRVAKGFSL